MQLVDLHRQRFRLEPITGAGRAGGRRHVALDLLARPGAVGLLPATLEVRHDAFEILDRLVGTGTVDIVELDLLLGALEDRGLRVAGKLVPAVGQLEAEYLSEAFKRLIIIG
ncbi:hypothetical protein D3C80_476900 [compost metagenome]